ncbi:hypothetical protein EV126DRAFT_416519, partial [Verticillium dahliae]
MTLERNATLVEHNDNMHVEIEPAADARSITPTVRQSTSWLPPHLPECWPLAVGCSTACRSGRRRSQLGSALYRPWSRVARLLARFRMSPIPLRQLPLLTHNRLPRGRKQGGQGNKRTPLSERECSHSMRLSCLFSFGIMRHLMGYRIQTYSPIGGTVESDCAILAGALSYGGQRPTTSARRFRNCAANSPIPIPPPPPAKEPLAQRLGRRGRCVNRSSGGSCAAHPSLSGYSVWVPTTRLASASRA